MSDLWSDDKLDKPSTLLKYNVHNVFQTLPIEKVKSIAEKQALPFSLMFYSLNGDINVGMAVRSAAIFGCSDVYIVGKRHYDRRTAVGAQNYIAIHRHASISPTFFKENQLIPIILEQGGQALEEFDFKPYLPGRLEKGYKVVLIVGSENFGFPKEFLTALKGAPILTIGQYGVMRSLNVSNAASIVLYEYAKQWRANAMARV